MTSTPTLPTGWLLTVEPLGSSLGWSLIRNDGRAELIDAGYIPDAQPLHAIASALHPSIQAPPNGHRRAGLWASNLTSPDDELAAASLLGRALLPQPLSTALCRPSTSTAPDTVTIATRGWTSSLPWELLMIDETGTRLLERALVIGGLTPVIPASRTRIAPQADPSSPGCAVVDPGPPTGAVPPLYPSGYPDRLTREFNSVADAITPAGVGTTKDDLAYHLHRMPSRFLYLGHVRPGTDADNADTALILSGQGPRGDHLTARQWLSEAHHWPAPARVALIGCASDDTSTYEQTGLVVSAINAGARLVTSTRWPLPADHPHPRACTPTQPLNHESLTDLAIAIHDAHTKPTALTHLRAWQLSQLTAWKHSGDLHHSPLLWASPISYISTSGMGSK
ncbi:MAG: CHAT domain-containing protein [Actinomycetales bacterium]